jgi:hypothetical protein
VLEREEEERLFSANAGTLVNTSQTPRSTRQIVRMKLSFVRDLAA